MDCKYYTEEAFTQKYDETNYLLFLNVHIQSLPSKYTDFLSFLDKLKENKCTDIFGLQVWGHTSFNEKFASFYC